MAEPESHVDPTQTDPAPTGAMPADKSGRGTRPWWLWAFVAGALLLFILGGTGGSYEGKLGDVQKNDNAAYLPPSAESTKVDKESQKFNPVATIPGFLVYHRDSGLTDADLTKINGDVAKLRALKGVASDQIAAPQISKDKTAASIGIPLVAKNGDVEVQGPDLSDAEKRVIAVGKAGNPDGLVVHSAGAGGLLVAFIDAFQGIDGKLLGIAGLVVIVLLLFVYRSPVLWIFPLFSAGLALGLSSLIIYLLAKNDVITLNGQSQGILSVLVIGAGTDYALLLISRYREELHEHQSRVTAMMTAWRGAAPAIGASSLTVILGLLCLLVSELNSNRGLGPVCAIGIACTVLVMLTFLPVALVVFGRWVFWPRVPRVDHQVDIATHGLWGGIAEKVGMSARRNWIATAVLLLVLVGFIGTLKSQGLTTTEGFTTKPDAVIGQKVFDQKFNQGAGTPAVITVNVSKADEVIAAAKKVSGVASGDAAVCLQPDYAKLAELAKQNPGGKPPAAQTTCLPAALTVQPLNGRTIINAQLTSSYDTSAAGDTVIRLRTALHAIPGADARIGGQAAITRDTLDSSRRDRNVIIPLVLLVIMIILGLLLRALVAPVVLILTVVLSFAATLGVSALVFNHVFHFADADPGFPLYAFIFLVALGIDYNIFLMTRVREETRQFGTRQGVLRGLSVTGGVITSAGVVLASTFAVLGVLPLVFLAELGFAVAFGVLLDSFIVRSILVPSLAYDMGKRIWWPSALARGKD
ncbi:MAG: MMPL family transporter [Jatrophihabitans sp.]